MFKRMSAAALVVAAAVCFLCPMAVVDASEARCISKGVFAAIVIDEYPDSVGRLLPAATTQVYLSKMGPWLRFKNPQAVKQIMVMDDKVGAEVVLGLLNADGMVCGRMAILSRDLWTMISQQIEPPV